MSETSEQPRGSGDLLASDGVAEVKRTQEDLALVARAIKRGWDVPPEFRSVLKERLRKIVEKDTVSVMTKDGPIELDGPADSNAIRAAGVVVAMAAQDQADDHLADKNKRMDEGKPTDRVALDSVVLERPVRPPAHK